MEMVFVFLVGVAMAGVLGLIIYLYVALSRIKTRLDEHEYIFDDALALVASVGEKVVELYELMEMKHNIKKAQPKEKEKAK